MKSDIAELQGAWNIVSLEIDGAKMAEGIFNGSQIILQENKFTTVSMGATYKGTYKVDESSTPKTIDMKFSAGPEKGNISLGIYELDGDNWKICLTVTATKRPKRFVTKAGSGLALETLKRAAPDKSSGKAPKGKRTTRADSSNLSKSPRPAASVPGQESFMDELARLGGHWSMVALVVDGRAISQEFLKTGERVAKGNQLTVTMGGQLLMKATFTVDPTRAPRTIDYTLTKGANQGQKQFGIYEWDGDEFRSCFAAPGNDRPAAFSTEAGDGRVLSQWKKIKG
jgi:uncharacterized protein (TIGR03067 family)